MGSSGAGPARQRFERDKFKQYLLVELISFCPDNRIIQEVSTGLEHKWTDEEHVFLETAVEIIAEAKVLVLENLRRGKRNGGLLRIDGLFTQYVRPYIQATEERNGWKMLCLAIMRLGSPCEYLLVDYYVGEVDRPELRDRWYTRPQCKETLVKSLSTYLDKAR